MTRNVETSSPPVRNQPSVRSGLAWMFSSQGVLSVLHVVVLMVLARLLSTAEFGVATVFLALAQICGVLATLGFGPALVQSQEATPRHVAVALKIAFLGGLVLGTGIYWWREPLSGLLKLQDQAGLFWLFIPLCTASGTQLVLRAVMQRQQRFRSLSTTEVASYLFAYSLPAITLAWLGYGPLAVVLGSILSLGVSVLTYAVLLRPGLFGMGIDWRSARELSRTGLGFGLSELISISTQNLDKLLVGGVLGPAAAGLYGRASSLMQTAVHTLSAPLDSVMFPTFSRAQEDPARLRELLRKTQILVFLLSFPVGLVMICAPEGLILLLLGGNWLEAAPLFQVFGVLVVVRVNGRAVDFILRARGLVYRRLLLMFAFSGFIVVFVLAGIRHGLVGVAIGVTLAFFAHMVLVAWLSLAAAQMRWRSFLGLVLWPLLWAGVIGSGLLLLLDSRWATGWHPLVILLLVGCAVLFLMGLTLFLRPKLLFGPGGVLARQLTMELLEQASRKLPPSVRRRLFRRDKSS